MTIADTVAILRSHEDSLPSLDATEAIAELKIELRNATTLTSEIERENANLKRQLQEREAFSRAYSERHAQWKEAWKKEREIVFDREKKLEKNEKQLEERRRELEELEKRHELTSHREEGSVHVNLLKEVQAEHAIKTERLMEEVSKWKKQFYDIRKTYECIQARNCELQSQIERERDIAETFEKEISSLQQAFAEHIEETEGNKTSFASLEGTVRDLKFQLEERELLMKSLQQEVKDMQKARDDAVCQRIHNEGLHEAEHGKRIHECAKHEAKVKMLEQRIQAAEKEMAHATKQSTEFEESIRGTKKELDRLRCELVAREEDYKQEVEKYRAERIQSERDLKNQLATAESVLAQEQAKTKDLERQCLETQEHATQQIADLAKDIKRDDQSGKLLDAQDEILKLENSCTNLKKEMKQLVYNYQAEVQRLQHACEICHKDLNLALMEKKEAEKNAAFERKKATQLQKELEQSEHRLLKLEEKVEDLTYENTSLGSQVKGTLEEVDSLKEQASNDREKASKVLHDEVENYKEQLSKEKCRSEAYKAKATEAHKRSKEAKKVLDSLCRSPK